MKKASIIVIILVVLVGGYFIFSGTSETPQLDTLPVSEGEGLDVTGPLGEVVEEEELSGEVREISISLNEFSLTPSSIQIKEGENIRLVVQNIGQFPHDLVIEGLALNTPLLSPGESAVLDFGVPVAGSYTFYCSVGDHQERGMEGILQVWVK